MADRTVQILPGGQSSAPYTYTVPASTAFTLMGVRAIIDGTGAAGNFLPCVQIVSDAGVVMAQTVGTSVAAGASVDATFAPFLENQNAGTQLDTTDGTTTVLPTDVLRIGSGLVLTNPVANEADLSVAAGAGGYPVISLISTTQHTFLLQPDGSVNNYGVPTGMQIGDVAVAYLSCVQSGVSTGTISPVTGPANWTAVAGNSHNTTYVWRMFFKAITGLSEPLNWDQFTFSWGGGGTATCVGTIMLFRFMSSTAQQRSNIEAARAGNLNPLVSGDLTTLARPGDALIFTVSSKNGSGNVTPPSGYTEVLDEVDGALWTYVAYKIAAGLESGVEKNASVSITPGAAADINDTFLVAFQHYGGA